MKRIPGWLTALLIIGLLIASKYLFFAKKEDKGGPQTKGKTDKPVSANYFVVTAVDFKNKLYSSGKIGAMNEVEIKPEIAGKVIAINFKEGVSVNKGDLLIKINDADIQAQLTKTRSQLKLSEEKLVRLKKLLEVNGVSQEEYDSQENEVNVLKAEQQFQLAQLAKTAITAPFSGVVGLKNISEGAYVTPNFVIASLVQLQPVFIEFSLPERYSGSIKKETAIKFINENTNITKEMDATVFAIEPRIDPLTKTLRCRALYKGSEVLYPGSFVKVFVELLDKGNTLMIPNQCLIPVLKGQKVIVCKNGIAEERQVITGVRTDELIQITEGISAGDTVLTTGLLAAKPGSKLNLINTK